MARKINPNSYRLGINVPWSSKWFYKKDINHFLEEDCIIYDSLKKDLPRGAVDDLNIERKRQDIKVIIKSNKPGLIIGRKGITIDEAKNNLIKKIKRFRNSKDLELDFNLDIEVVEMKRTDVSASIVAEQLAMDLERRIPYRTAMKSHLKMLNQNREIKGAKIRVAGRLNGADIARTEWLDFGKMPLSTLRANIDYAETTAYTTYGTIGVRAWIYKGDVFEEDNN